MGLLTQNSRTPLIAVLTAVALIAMPCAEAPAASKSIKAGTAAPQQPQKPPANEAEAKQREAEAAKRAYDEGIKSYQAGKFQPAVDELSAALRGGGLASTDMARGLYLRGLAYKKLSKPGLAISDLTSALWLKNGLNDADRKSASAERADAYKAAGLGDGNSGGDTVAVAEPAPAAAAPAAAKKAPAPAAPAATPAATASPAATAGAPAAVEAAVPQALSTTGGSAPALTGEAHGAAKISVPIDAAVPFGTTPMAAQPAAGSSDRPSSASAANTAATLGPTSPGAAPSLGSNAAPASDGAAPVSASTSSVSGFFSNLLPGKGPTTPAAPPPASVTTASTGAAPSSKAQVPSGSVAAATDKSSPAKTARGEPASSATAAASGAAKPAATVAQKTAPAVTGGKYKVHIAALRSRPEADALAQKIAQQHAAALNNRAPTVDEAVIGSMGKFYRVRIGSYATADEPRGLCNTLRNSGYDCLVVSN